jgi:hypothetical protein
MTRAASSSHALRRERLAQDSSLKSYDIGRQRRTLTAGIGAGVQRTAHRSESAFHIRWRDSVGAEVQLTGARVGIPIVPEAGKDALKDEVTNPDMSPVPYSSGQEPLWPVRGMTRGQVDDCLVHPLATGAEAYYTYESGAGSRRSGLRSHRHVTVDAHRPRAACGAPQAVAR